MRTFADSYWKLIEYLKVHPTGEVEYSVWPDGPQVVYVSIKHAACLSYLVWLHEGDSESLRAFVEVGVEWRKQNSHYLKRRPKVMKKVALLRKKLAQLELREKRALAGKKGTKTQVENKIGVHSEDYPMEQHVQNGKKGHAKQMAEGRPPHAKHWLIIDPHGRKFQILNMNEFCRKKGLQSGHMYAVANGSREHHKGYKCRRIKPRDINDFL